MLEINDTTLYFEETGSGSETIVFSHGLLMSCRMFDDQVAEFKNDHSCLAFDFRGQGKSGITASGYDMDTLAGDAAALIEKLDCAPCHFVGLSMGGFVGMRLAIRRPELLRSLVLIDTTAEPEPAENIGRYRMLNFISRWFGMRLVINRVMPILFGEKFLNDTERAVLRNEWKERIIGNRRTGTSRAVRGVIERKGVEDMLDKITVPTLILVGDQDVATVPGKSIRMNERIKNSQLVIIEGAGHSSTVEEPAAINRALRAFLAKPDAEDQLEK